MIIVEKFALGILLQEIATQRVACISYF